LKQGNDNWSKKGRRLLHPNQTAARREAVKDHQSPFAVVLTCSDSRVPPEVVFDRGVGDLFVIRVAGNVLDKHATGSIQYAVEVKKYAKLIVVLGHQRCGAVEAAVQDLKLPEPLATLVNALRPAVEASRRWPGDPVENAVDANIHLIAKQLTDLFQKDGAVVMGKRYSLDTGEVSDPQPWKP
jgi:carbonic anhydrase